jgi:hypothetical protein
MGSNHLLVFPAHALLIVEERLREQEAEGVRMHEGVPLDELALRVLIAATLAQARGAGRRRCAGPEEGRDASEHPAPWLHPL